MRLKKSDLPDCLDCLRDLSLFLISIETSNSWIKMQLDASYARLRRLNEMFQDKYIAEMLKRYEARRE